MTAVENNAYYKFSELAGRTAVSGALRKLTLSKPSADAPYKKITVTLYLDGDTVMAALEGALSDGKMIRKNHAVSEIEKVISDTVKYYGQGNILSSDAEAQLMVSKKGKVTLVGADKLERSLKSGITAEIRSGNNKKKNYIFDPSESWLFELGITSADGRIHDKKQSKFRQINRFTELLDDVYGKLPPEGVLNVCDLCCGKSYLSFAVYEYLTSHKNREVRMLCIDRKADVIEYCSGTAKKISADGLYFVADDIGNDEIYKNTFGDGKIHLTVSLHACDIATDIVLRRAILMKSEVILSTPCCHHELYGKVRSKELEFITSHSMLAQKLNDAVTDGLRVKMLETEGYSVDTVELVDPEETPKNVLIRAIRKKKPQNREKSVTEYNSILDFLGLRGSYYDIYKD